MTIIWKILCKIFLKLKKLRRKIILIKQIIFNIKVLFKILFFRNY